MTFQCSPLFLQTVTFPAAFLCVSRRPAGRQTIGEDRRRKGEGRRGSQKVRQSAASLPFPPSFAFSVFHVTFSKVCVFTQSRSLSGAENNVPLRLNLLVRPQAKTVMCLIFIINSNPRFCSWFKLEVVRSYCPRGNAVVGQKIGSQSTIRGEL